MKLFDFSNVKLNWFPGHMATGLKQIQSRLQNDPNLIIIEVRDSRIPFSSGNTEVILKSNRNPSNLITVYNKSDLAEEREITGKDSILFCSNDRMKLKSLYEMIQIKVSSMKSSNYSYQKNRVMVVGIPNVGKSTIINGLRMVGTGIGGKAVKVGNLAGVTKCLSELVCISRNPLIYLIDTPGILAPRILDVQDGLKVALCGGFYDKTVGMKLLAEFLLYNLNCKKDTPTYTNLLKYFNSNSSQAENINLFLPLVGKRVGALLPGGEVDLERAAGFIVRQFRSGKLGKLSLE